MKFCFISSFRVWCMVFRVMLCLLVSWFLVGRVEFGGYFFVIIWVCRVWVSEV